MLNRHKSIAFLLLFVMFIGSIAVFTSCSSEQTQISEKAKYAIYSDQSVEEISQQLVKTEAAVEENKTVEKISNLREFKKALSIGKGMSDVDVAKEMLRAMGYAEDIIERMPEAALLDTLNYTEHFAQTEFIPVAEDDDAEAGSAVAATENFSGSATSSGITITVTMSVDPENRRIKNAAWFDCSGNDMVVTRMQSGASFIENRGKQYIYMMTENAKFANVNNNEGMSFAIMSFDYYLRNFNLLEGKNSTQSGRSYVYSETKLYDTVYSCAFGFNLPHNESALSSALINWQYDYTAFRFYMQFYTIYNVDEPSGQNVHINTLAAYSMPEGMSIDGFGLSFGFDGVGGELTITPGEGYEEIAKAQLGIAITRDELVKKG